MSKLHERNYTRTECIIAVVDVLDQRREIMAFKNAKDELARAEIFKRTVERRDHLAWVAEDALKGTFGESTEADLAKLDKDKRNFHDAYKREVQMNVYSFADTTTFYLRLDQRSNGMRLTSPAELIGILSIIHAAGAVILDCLAERIPVRGGIAEGIGFVANDTKEVYGPAFLDAHDLEQHYAQSPRIIVSPALMSRIQTTAGSAEKIAPLAAGCLQLLYEDDDGFFAIDYLNQKFSSTMEHFETRFDKAHRFVNEEQQRFAKSQDLKLSPRYFRLSRYFRTNTK